MNDTDLTNLEKQTAVYVTGLYNSADVPHYPYHNLEHTVGVVDHSREIAEHYMLGVTDTFVLVVAAWFHDVGHLYGPMPGHEARGVTIMREHLVGVDAGLVDAIGDCIMATKLPSHPLSLLHKIICDADTYHFGTTLFLETDPRVRQELELRTGKIFPNWRQKTLELLQQHQFFTEYCQTRLNEGKAKNIAFVREQIGRP
jgi:predicted metal-dependent HD superfamily phosphohydrolase